jgi:beta-galactosidase/beta-glucuronidase
MYPHRIRLRGPWNCEPLARLMTNKKGEIETVTNDLPSPIGMTMPCRWAEGGLRNFTGRVRFCRHFGYPGRIDENERVWLTLAGVGGNAQVWLNDYYLASVTEGKGGFEFEITKLLRERNELRVEIEGEADSGGLWGEVALEIRLAS